MPLVVRSVPPVEAATTRSGTDRCQRREDHVDEALGDVGAAIDWRRRYRVEYAALRRGGADRPVEPVIDGDIGIDERLHGKVDRRQQRCLHHIDRGAHLRRCVGKIESNLAAPDRH